MTAFSSRSGPYRCGVAGLALCLVLPAVTALGQQQEQANKEQAKEEQAIQEQKKRERAQERKRNPEIVDLGNQKYRIGAIRIDKAAGSFSVGGRILRDAPPLEFLVATRRGHKSYESLLAVNANAYQLNLACILIGLDASKAVPRAQRDFSQPVQGDPVEISFSWLREGKTVRATAAEMLVQGEPPQVPESDDWVYTGSTLLPDGRFLANLAGTAVGFVKKGESLIEHRQGIGVGNYGSINVNRDVVPPVGTRIKMSIRRPPAAATQESPTAGPG